MLTVVVTATEVRRQFDRVLALARRHVVIVTRWGVPSAVIVSPKRYRELTGVTLRRSARRP